MSSASTTDVAARKRAKLAASLFIGVSIGKLFSEDTV
jgi:hypothetical protein